MLSFAAIAVLAFVLALLFIKKKVAKKVVVYLMVIASLGLAGILGSVLGRVAGSATAGASSATGQLFGTAVPFVLAVLVLAYLVIHMMPKGQPPTKLTPWIALVSVPILLAAGGVFAQMATEGRVTVADITTSAGTFITSLFGG